MKITESYYAKKRNDQRLTVKMNKNIFFKFHDSHKHKGENFWNTIYVNSAHNHIVWFKLFMLYKRKGKRCFSYFFNIWKYKG